MSSFGVRVPDGMPQYDAGAEWRAGQLVVALPTINMSVNCATVYERLLNDDSQPAIAVVDDSDHVVGLINRLLFMTRYAQRYVPEIYGKRSVCDLANLDPFIVDENVPVAELASMIALDHADALRDCFVVTSRGRYLGIGTSEALVRSKLSLLMLREKQLREALFVARDANQTKSNFLALMSHELRTPLNAIIGFSEVLETELFGPHTSPRYREYSGDIQRAGKHLLALINDILDLSKAEAGRLDLRRDTIALPELFEECCRMVSDRATAHGLKLTRFLPPDMPKLIGDRLRLKQILINLLTNAVKFTPQGGEVSLSTQCGSDGGVVIRVRDTGIGMAPEEIPRALEPFHQIASPMARQHEGTGLGLSLVKSLTELHDGKLCIQSAVNEGTTVSLSFPPARTLDDEGLQESA